MHNKSAPRDPLQEIAACLRIIAGCCVFVCQFAWLSLLHFTDHDWQWWVLFTAGGSIFSALMIVFSPELHKLSRSVTKEAEQEQVS